MLPEQRRQIGNLMTIIGLSDRQRAEADAETREFYDGVRALHKKTVDVVQRGSLVEEDTKYPHHETAPVEVSEGVHVRLVEKVSRFKDPVTDEQTGDLYTYGVNFERVFPDSDDPARQILHVQQAQVRDWNNEVLKPGQQSNFIMEAANGMVDMIDSTLPSQQK